MAGVTAFREAYMSAGIDADDFGMFAARRLRYEVLWAFFENTAYRDLLNRWATKFKSDYGLYKYIRGIYNPAFRLGTFWQAHLWGGALDPNAGDGKSAPNALPIEIPDANPLGDELRAAIGLLWKFSNWQTNKDILTLRGAVMGDSAIKIIDDTTRGRVYLKPIHPGTLADVTLDAWGNVKAYRIEEVRHDPRVAADVDRDVTYTEIATRDGDDVVYQTLLDGTPYAWNVDSEGNGIAEWTMPYGFVPLVFIKHNDVGLDWGWSEMHGGFAKFNEANDIASKADDQIRKMVDAPWLFAGVNAPSSTPTATNTSASSTKPQPGREEIPALYGPVGASATPLVASLDLAATLEHIKSLLAEIERDYPELKVDELRATGTVTGRAMELAQQPAADKVLQRRPNYDNALVRAHQMAIAIGGFEGYAGFEGFNLDSFLAGKLEHVIGARDVFAKTRADQLDEELQFWNAANAAAQAVPIEIFLRRQGWSDEELNAMYGAMPQP